MSRRLDRPEILAPAGDEESLRAAVNAGADAVYFGLTSGFNARARAANFDEGSLPGTLDYLHRRGVQAFVTFNTLVFDSELAAAERALSAIARAGADAIIVQDLGAARLARAICPELPLHASTQMTISSAEAARIAAELGVTRVVLPRELSIEEIAKFAAGTDLELEVFVHGALCMSYSGQCLTSEAWGGRSANRGQCAQSCRLPYDLMVDGAQSDAGGLEYFLSPKDLAAYDLLPELLAAGVSCFKIEGRMKGPEYVASTVEKYRRSLDAAMENKPLPLSARDVEELEYSFSRGLGPGFLKGDNHQALVHGRFPGHRGRLVGRVEEVLVRERAVLVRPDADAAEVKSGDRIVFDQGKPEDEEQRGSVYEAFYVTPDGRSASAGEDASPASPDRRLRVEFGDPGPDLRVIGPNDLLWKTKDADHTRAMKKLASTERKVALDLDVRGRAGEALEAVATDALGRRAQASSGVALQAATGRALDEALVREKLAAFGETGFTVRELRVTLTGALALPPSELKRMRRALVEALESQAPPAPPRHVASRVEVDALTAPPSDVALPLDTGAPRLIPLCRTKAQVDAAIASGCDEVELDFMELVGLGEAVRTARGAGLRVVIATPRIQKPGEEGWDRRFESLAPDGVLVRHLGALEHFRRLPSSARDGFSLHGDFSLNATNALTARTLLGLGLTTLTPAYDLDLRQMGALFDGVPARRFEVTIHQHLPIFHNEHCVYAHTLSKGKDWRDCGRPCEQHAIGLRDRLGYEHPVLVDIGCRNTVFNAQAQSAGPVVPGLVARGVRRFRIEFVRESQAEAERAIAAYRRLVAGEATAPEVARAVGAAERYGVTLGTFAAPA